MDPLLSVIQQEVIPWITQPWHWAVSGTLIALTMFTLLKLGKEFGVSSNLRTMCTIMGAGKRSDFFRINWKDQTWNLLFVGGAVIGGFIASHFMMSPEPVQISQATQDYLAGQGVATPQTLAEGTGFVPESLVEGYVRGVRVERYAFGAGILPREPVDRIQQSSAQPRALERAAHADHVQVHVWLIDRERARRSAVRLVTLASDRPQIGPDRLAQLAQLGR